MPTQAVADARGPQWRKVIFNAATNPVGALTGLTHGRVCERPDLRALVTGLVDEGKAVAAAQGVELDADPEQLIDHARASRRRVRPQGVDAPGRRGAPADGDRLPERRHLRFGREHGVPTPLNEAISALDERSGGVVDAELTRRYANVREALARDGLDAADRLRQRVLGLRRRGHVPLAAS